jgi:CheY-like chemotaxis protein
MAIKIIDDSVKKYQPQLSVQNSMSDEVQTANRRRIQPLKLLLLDFQMPKMNGFQVITKLKQRIMHRNKFDGSLHIVEPQYVVLTAFLTPVLKRHGESLGVTSIYDKPVLIDKL